MKTFLTLVLTCLLNPAHAVQVVTFHVQVADPNGVFAGGYVNTGDFPIALGTPYGPISVGANTYLSDPAQTGAPDSFVPAVFYVHLDYVDGTSWDAQCFVTPLGQPAYTVTINVNQTGNAGGNPNFNLNPLVSVAGEGSAGGDLGFWFWSGFGAVTSFKVFRWQVKIARFTGHSFSD